VPVGTIGERASVPVDVDQWQWSCDFYPGTEPAEFGDGIAPDFFTTRQATSADSAAPKLGMQFRMDL